MTASTVAFGVYVHIPFCAHRCDYCDFATWTDRDHLVDDYVDACVHRPRTRGSHVTGSRRRRRSSSAGARPRCIPAADLARILGAVPRVDGCRGHRRVQSRLGRRGAARGVLAAAGVDRVSLGVQSFRPHVLATLGRTHDPANVFRAVAVGARAGIERVNLDLIYGAPGEPLADWRATLDGALALGPDHVSAYALTVESGTPLGQASPPAAGRARRRRPGGEVRAGRRRARRRGPRVVRDLELGPPGGGVPPQPPLLGRATTTSRSAVPRTARPGTRRWWNLRTPERYIDARVRGALDRGGKRDPRRRGSGRARVLALALRTRGGVGDAASTRTS